MKNVLLSFALLIFFAIGNAQPGSPDISFGNNGIVFTDIGANITLIANTCRKILLLNEGSFYLVVGSSPSYVTRRLPDGSIDTTYGEKGYSNLMNFNATSAALQADGKMIVGGISSVDFAVARLKPNGSLDSSFSDDGITVTNFPTQYGSALSLLYSIAIQNDGKIIAAGSSEDRFTLTRYLTNGTLDNSFSGDGKLMTDFGSNRSAANGIAVQNDGKIVAAGYCIINNSNRIAIARYMPDGSVDPSFSFDGFETIYWGTSSEARAVKLQPDNKIVIAGDINPGNRFQFGIARLLPNGELDHTFSGDGIQSISFGSNSGMANDMLLQPDGKIVLGGIVYDPGSHTDFGLARFNADGSLDNSFSDDGTTSSPIRQYSDDLHSIALQQDGKIFAAGSVYIAPTSGFAVLKFNQNGTLDNSFGFDGVFTGFKPSFSTTFNASDVQADGKLVVVGFAWAKAWWTEKHETEMAVVRYNVDGTLDQTFSDDGKLIIDYGTGAGSATSIAIQQDGKLVIGGTVSIGSYNDFAVIRLNSDGTFDNSFSGDGKLLTDFGNTEDQCYSIAIQQDGKIIAAGSMREYGVQRFDDIAIARYNTDGSLDNTFSGDGKLTTDFIAAEGSSVSNGANTVLVQQDGKIVVTGQYALWTAHIDFMAVRYLSNGDLDLSFNGTGIVTTDFGGSIDQPRTAALQPDGKIIIAGLGYSLSGYFAAVRYNTDGSLDNTFSGDGILRENLNTDLLAIAIEPDGKIIFGGFGAASGSAITNDDVVLYRYNSNGTPDNSFGVGGQVFRDIGGFDKISDLSISGNRLYAVGTSSSEGYIGFVAAYNLASSLYVAAPKDTKTEFVKNIDQAWIEVYPNPSSSQFKIIPRIAGDEIFTINIYDAIGKLMERKQVKTNQQLMLGSNYRPGIYYVECITRNSRTKTKLIKQ